MDSFTNSSNHYHIPYPGRSEIEQTNLNSHDQLSTFINNIETNLEAASNTDLMDFTTYIHISVKN